MPESPTSSLTLEELAARLAVVERERDEYKRLYVATLEAFKKLEAGLTRHVRERFGGGEQLALSLMAMMTPGQSAVSSPPAQTEVAAHKRVKPTGRKPLPAELPRVDIEVTPPDVQRKGLDAFVRIGEHVTETVERRPAAVVVLRTVRPKYVPKSEGAPDEPKVLQAPAPQLPIPRLKAGPGILADSIVKRWDDHLPLHRMERIYGREGLPIARSTICGWHFAVAELVKRVVDAMWLDALSGNLLCMDATGVLVQEREKCRKAHFFVVIAPGKHVLFGYTPKHDSDAVKKLVRDFKATSSSTRTPSTTSSSRRATSSSAGAGLIRGGTGSKRSTPTARGRDTRSLSSGSCSSSSARTRRRRPTRSSVAGRSTRSPSSTSSSPGATPRR